MSSKGRTSRVGELIREEIAKLITKGIKDPRIGFVSVMAVKMSADLHYANVYVSLFGDESERKGSLIGLRNSAGWIRREVGKYLKMRYTPEIRFFPDDTLDTVYHLAEVFEEIHEEQRQSPMLVLTLDEILAELRKADSLLLTTHVNPDGDAIGSLLAMRLFLKALGKSRVSMAVDGTVPPVYSNLPGTKRILSTDDEPPNFDTLVMLDCSSYDRIGTVVDWLEPETRVIVLDHHREPGPPGTVGHIDSKQAATGELLIDLFDTAGIEISTDSALCLYVAQTTDTGGYRFSNTTALSHEKAARLIRTGIDVGKVSNDVFNTTSRPKFELKRRVMEHASVNPDIGLAYSWLAPEDFADNGASREDTEGLVNLLTCIDGVRVSALFTASSPTDVKVSLRSDGGFDCAAFLNDFGGGGHVPAAGATLSGPLKDSMEHLLSVLESQLAESGKAGGNEAE